MKNNKKIFASPTGMQDILPDQVPAWTHVEKTIYGILSTYNFQEIRLHMLEHKDLFVQSLGGTSDIVRKEMYYVEETDFVLRPEGTASCVRSMLNHNMINGIAQRVFYYGPMFRKERPQKGRLRQFHQLGIESFCPSDSNLLIQEAEVIMLTAEIWQKLSIKTVLEINNIGTMEERTLYKKALCDYLEDFKKYFNEQEAYVFQNNPLRLLDSKSLVLKDILLQAPEIDRYVDNRHFHLLVEYLRSQNICLQVNTRLMRGLDYYSHTVFEWISQDDNIGAQSAICSGGRYDSFFQNHRWMTHAFGCAMGMERILLHDLSVDSKNNVDIYICSDTQVFFDSILIAKHFKDRCKVFNSLVSRSVKNHIHQASSMKAKYLIHLQESSFQIHHLFSSIGSKNYSSLGELIATIELMIIS